MLYDFTILLLGLLILVKASSITISNAVKISKLSGISELAIGFILIAVSTSIPEMAIAIISSFEGHNAISFGNLIGANIANLTLVFAVMAFYGASFRMRGVVEIDKAIILTTMVALLLMIIGKSDFIFGVFCVSLFYMFSSFVYNHEIKLNNFRGLKTVETLKSLFFVVASVFAIVISAHFVVNAAIAIASDLGVSETILGATILALGTTLPELTVNLAAIKQRRYSIAIGDSIGSILTNLTLVLGIASIISPIIVTPQSFVLLASLIFVNLFFVFIARRKFGLTEGAALFSVYALYILTVTIYAA